MRLTDKRALSYIQQSRHKYSDEEIIITSDDRRLTLDENEEAVMNSARVAALTAGTGTTNWVVCGIKLLDVTQSED